MGWGYRKRKQILPGVWLNFSKRGISTTIGKRGASVNFGSRGSFLNLVIPGTGLYSRQRISSGSRRSRKESIASNNVQQSTNEYHPRYGCGWFGCGAALCWFLLFGFIISAFTGDFEDKGDILPPIIAYLLFFHAKDIWRLFVRNADNDNDDEQVDDSMESHVSRISSLYSPVSTHSPVSTRVTTVNSANESEDLFLRIAEFVVTKRRVNVPLIQSEFKIDSNTTYDIINKLEKMRIIGVEIGLTPRHILVKDLDELRDLIDRQKRQEQSDSTVNGSFQP